MLQKKLFFGLVAVFVITSGIFAAEEINNKWQAVGGGQWNNPSNWQLGVPTLGQDARIDQPGLGPTISSGTNAVCDSLRGPSFEGGECTMAIDGGTLTIERDWRIADEAGSGPGIINMNAGQVHVKNLPEPGDPDPGKMKLGGEGEGVFNMFGGTLTVGPGAPPFQPDSGSIRIPHEGSGKGTLNVFGGQIYAPRVRITDDETCGNSGYINMFAGTLTCADLHYPGPCIGALTNDWKIDIYDGIIQIMGYGGADAADKARIEGYVASGNIVGQGGDGQVVVELSAGVVTVSSPVGPIGCMCSGDLNADGQRDLEDLQALAEILLEAGSPFIVADPPDCADLTEDGQADLEDLQALAEILLGVGSPFILGCEWITL